MAMFTSDAGKAAIKAAILRGDCIEQLIEADAALRRQAVDVRTYASNVVDEYCADYGDADNTPIQIDWVNEFEPTAEEEENTYVQTVRRKYWVDFDTNKHTHIVIKGYTQTCIVGNYSPDFLISLASGKPVVLVTSSRNWKKFSRINRLTVVSKLHPREVLPDWEKYVNPNVTIEVKPVRGPKVTREVNDNRISSEEEEPVRADAIQLFTRVMPLDKAVDLELAVFTLAVDSFNRAGYAYSASWAIEPFRGAYSVTVYAKYLQLTHRNTDRTILEGYCNGKSTATAIAELKDIDIFPAQWDDLIRKEHEASKNESVGFRAITIMETCRKCGCKKVYHDERQTRSADEPATQFYECTNCMAKWKR